MTAVGGAAWPTVLADVARRRGHPVDSHFFDDLGADSLVMARFCARMRKQPDLPPVSMKDIYRHPTIAAPGRGAGPARTPTTADPTAGASCSEAPATGADGPRTRR